MVPQFFDFMPLEDRIVEAVMNDLVTFTDRVPRASSKLDLEEFLTYKMGGGTGLRFVFAKTDESYYAWWLAGGTSSSTINGGALNPVLLVDLDLRKAHGPVRNPRLLRKRMKEMLEHLLAMPGMNGGDGVQYKDFRWAPESGFMGGRNEVVVAML